jgi:hypothetical protein
MLWRTCTPPLLPLQDCLLLRPQLPKVRLEGPPQRLRTHHADLLCTCYTKLLQPHQPHERILKMKVIVQETAIAQQYPHAAKRNERWSQRSRGAAKGGTMDVISRAKNTCYELMIRINWTRENGTEAFFVLFCS